MIRRKLSKYSKVLLVLLIILSIATIFLMIYDYCIHSPYPEGHQMFNKRGNVFGSLYVFIPLVLFEFLIGYLIVINTYRLNILFRVLIIVLILIWCVFSFANTIHRGGVEALHAFWISGFLIINFLLLIIEKVRR